MSKKNIYILTGVLILILLALVGYYLIYSIPSGTGDRPSIFRNFFPLGGSENISTSTTTPQIEVPEEPERPIDYIKKLRKISSEPVAGSGTEDVKAGTVVRYIEKATGHIYEVELFSPRQGRISNTTIPQVYDAVWGNKNNSLIARYLKEDNKKVDTYTLNLKGVSTSTENTIYGVSFPVQIDDVSVFGDTVFYLQKNTDGSYGYTSKFDGSNKKQIWNSAINELISQFVNAKNVVLTTKPDAISPGFLYLIDTTNGNVKKILGNIFGLSTLVSADANQVLYLNQGGTPQLYTFNIKTKTTENITPVAFPEKCVWSKKDTNIVYCAVSKEPIDNNSLTMWYKGQIALNDDIWKYNFKDKTSDMLLSLDNESGELIDVIKPILTENEQYLVFINKRDNSLWSLDLTK